MSDLVKNPEDRFSLDAAHVSLLNSATANPYLSTLPTSSEHAGTDKPVLKTYIPVYSTSLDKGLSTRKRIE